MTGYSLSIQNLSYSYRNKRVKLPVFRELNLSFKANQLHAIIGNSGKGKSTLLKLLAGVEQHDSGAILFDEHVINNEHQQSIAYLPQDDILAPYLTVAETLHHHAVIRKTPNHRGRIDELLFRLRLTEERDRQIKFLSGGQRKRVSIALELLDNPRLMLLDEPSANLDSGNAKNIYQLLTALRDQGMTILAVTHREEEKKYFNTVTTL